MTVVTGYGWKMARGAGCILLLMLAGCMGPDKAELTELIPLDAGSFEYRVLTNPFHSAEADGGAEGLRLAWLAADMQSSQLCGDSYDLISRRVVFQYQAPDGYPINQIVYRGRCRV